MIYSEAAYDGHPCKHVAAYEDHKRVTRIERETLGNRRLTRRIARSIKR